jgi:hypothetical protein
VQILPVSLRFSFEKMCITSTVETPKRCPLDSFEQRSKFFASDITKVLKYHAVEDIYPQKKMLPVTLLFKRTDTLGFTSN